MTSPRDSTIAALRAEARYRRERVELYRRKLYAGRAESSSRLAELERARAGAESRLERALKADP